MKISSRLLSLGMLVMVSLVLSSCNLGVSMPSSSNSGMPSSSGQTGGGQPSGPKDGAVMAFGDGSVLIFFPNPDGVDNNGRKGFWITFNAISNYQYSLCVQAGKCTLPTDPNALNDYNNPEKENSPFQIVGPDISAVVASSSYCEWINGRIPTDKEIAIIGDGSTFGVRPEGGLNTAVFTGGQAADGGVHSLFCVMDRPQPMPRFVRNVPFYDPSQPMEDTTPKITQSVQFCQSGQGFQTFDLQLDSDQKIESVNGDGNSTCQMVSENRVVCFGNPSTNLQAEVAFNCDGAHNLSCPIGSEFDGAGCSNNMHGKPIQGMEDWEVNGDGVLMPTNGVQLPSGGVFLPKVPDLIVINGVMTAHQIWNGPQYNYIPSTPPTDVNQGCAACRPISACPPGFYPDAGTGGCTSLAAPLPRCLAGYHFNSGVLGCESDQPNGNYPGCPNGQVLDPITGMCDAKSRMDSPTSLTMIEPLQVNLPDCTVQANAPDENPVPGTDTTGGTSSSSSSGGLCPAGQKYVCSGIKVLTCSCQ